MQTRKDADDDTLLTDLSYKSISKVPRKLGNSALYNVYGELEAESSTRHREAGL